MDNYWVGHSAMKQVDAQSFQRRKYVKKEATRITMTLIWILQKKDL